MSSTRSSIRPAANGPIASATLPIAVCSAIRVPSRRRPNTSEAINPWSGIVCPQTSPAMIAERYIQKIGPAASSARVPTSITPYPTPSAGRRPSSPAIGPISARPGIDRKPRSPVNAPAAVIDIPAAVEAGTK